MSDDLAAYRAAAVLDAGDPIGAARELEPLLADDSTRSLCSSWPAGHTSARLSSVGPRRRSDVSWRATPAMRTPASRSAARSNANVAATRQRPATASPRDGSQGRLLAALERVSSPRR